MRQEFVVQDLSAIIELLPDPELGGFTARLPDIPAYGEGETEEAIADLRAALEGYFATFGTNGPALLPGR